MKPWAIDPEIRRSATLPGEFYRSREVYDALVERVLARSWQWVGHEREVERERAVRPFELLPGSLDEPLLLTRDDAGRLHCLSNVCTHRANLVQVHAGTCAKLRCGYHGRRFRLDGRFEHMPEFEGVEGVGEPADDLRRLPLESFAGQLFTSIAPEHPFEDLVAHLRERVGHLPFRQFRHDPARAQDYVVDAHWALYVDNYLEGFHVPYVHPELARTLDYGAYSTEVFERASLQVGVARAGEPVFDGTDVAALYYWAFPNTMFNFYPWGLSMNVVQPLGLERTRVAFRSFVWRPELLDRGAGSALDKVQREDEAIVEQVQRGTRSRLYDRGRFSPRREQAVHHFHHLLQAGLEG